MRGADPSQVATHIVDRLGGNHLLLLCDFDGTLTEFQPDPKDVWLPPERQAILQGFAHHARCTVGIVSGRRMADVRDRCRLEAPAYFAGLHGLEIEGGGDRFVHPQVDEARALVQGVASTLARRTADVPGAFLEDKGLSIAVHYRNVAPELHSEITSAFDLVTREVVEAGRLRVMRGAFVLELLPNIPWNKGDAVRWIARHVVRAGRSILPVYFGDDVTDEDAFHELERSGIGIAASERVTGGDYHVDGPAEVETVLRELARALD